MALVWTLTMKDGISGTARKSGAGLDGLREKMKALSAAETKSAAIRDRHFGKGLDVSQLGKATKEMQKQQKLQAKMAAHQKSVMAERMATKPGKSTMGQDLFVGAAGGAAAIGAAAFGGMAAMTWDLGQQIGQAQEFKLATTTAFENILKSKEAAADAYRLAQKTAIDTGSDYRESISSMNSLMAQGFDVSFADTLVKRMADLKTLNPAAKLEGITRAISQIKSTGKLQGDEMMQLAEAGLNVGDVYKQIAKDMGIVDGKKNKKGQAQSAVEQVQALQKTGDISADAAISAIMKTLENQSGGKAAGVLAMEKANKSLTGAIMRAHSFKEMLLESIEIDWSPLTRMITRLQEAFASPAGEKFIKKLSEGFNRLLGWFDKISDKDLAETLTTMGDAFETFSKSLIEIADTMMKVIRATNDLNGAVKDGTGGKMNLFDSLWDSTKTFLIGLLPGGTLYLAIDGLVEMFSGLGARIGSALSGAWEAVSGFVSGIGESIAGVTDGLWESVTGIGTNMVDGIVAGIESGAAAIVNALVGACESAVSAAEEALGIASPSKVMRQEGRFTAQGMAIGINDEAPKVATASYSMAAGAAQAGANVARTGQTSSTTANTSKTVQITQNFHGSDADNQRALGESMASIALSGA